MLGQKVQYSVISMEENVHLARISSCHSNKKQETHLSECNELCPNCHMSLTCDQGRVNYIGDTMRNAMLMSVVVCCCHL